MRCLRLVRQLVLALPALAAAAQDSKPTLKIEDIPKLRTVLRVDVSDDGRWIAFTRTAPRLAADGVGPHYIELFAMRADEGSQPVRLVGGKRRFGAFAFRPGSKWLTFTMKGSGDPHTEVWGVELERIGSDATAVKLTETARGVGAFGWSPQGERLAFTMRDEVPTSRIADKEAGFGAVVVDEDYTNRSLYVLDTRSNETQRMTETGSVFGFEWTDVSDSNELIAAIAPRNVVDDSYMQKRLHTVDTAGAELRIGNPGKLGAMAYGRDNGLLAYVGAADRRDPHAGTLFIEGRRVQPADFEGMFHDLAIRGDHLYASVSRSTTSELWRMDFSSSDPVEAAGKARVATRLVGQQGLAFTHFAIGGDTIALVASTPKHPEEIFTLSGNGEVVRRTHSNRWLSDRRLGRQRVERFHSVESLDIEGLLIAPEDDDGEFAPDTRTVDEQRMILYPLVIIAHGGPEAHYSNGWLSRYSEPGQVLAGRGYYVWYPNYRASTGRGVAFAKADHGDPMGDEFQDHLEAIEYFAEQYGIDRTRVGIIGGSYGGYTAAWAATRHTEHFAAAVSFVPFVDIETKWMTSDIPVEFLWVHYQERLPYEQRGFLQDRSPLTWAHQCKTPLLLCGGTSDPRVHPSQPFMLYRAVQMSTDTRVRYVQYPGEGHGNRVNVNRFDYMVRAIRWLDTYLAPTAGRDAPKPPRSIDTTLWSGIR